MLKKTDIITIIAIFLCCLVLLLFTYQKTGGKSIQVTVNNKNEKLYPLDVNGKFLIKTKFGSNTLVIKDNAAYFINSNCPDKTCQKIGKIYKSGQSIVCLPHRVVAEVVE